MLDEKTRTAIALKRFSLIGPILNGQVSSITDYCSEVTNEPIEMPHYGFRKYAPRTINAWYSVYMKGGIDALKPSPRSDKGTSRKLTPFMTDCILEKIAEYPLAPSSVIFDMMVNEGTLSKEEVSIASFRRFRLAHKNETSGDDQRKQMFRFAKENVNDLWMTDLMYGPYIGAKKKKTKTYLLAYIDDSSRFVTYAQFYTSQDITTLRHSFKEAVLRRGIPAMLYSDNGSIYKSQGFEYLCASIGVSLAHHAPGMAHQKGKIERFFRTVRSRFISILQKDDLADIDVLNAKFQAWLHEDYNNRPHSGLSGAIPMECFLQQADKLNLVTDLSAFNMVFMLTAMRKVKADATISFDSTLYETDMTLAGCRVEVRYDPEMLDESGSVKELYLYRENKPVGTARPVCFAVNAERKRAKHPDKTKPEAGSPISSIAQDTTALPSKTNTISYYDAMGGEA
jgi:transposase InsO family protein